MYNRLLGSLAALALSALTLMAQVPQPVVKDKLEGESSQANAGSRPVVKKWTMMDLEGLLGAGLEGARNYEKGRAYFRQATCLACHRFKEEGSAAGPDLTAIALKHGPADLLAHILEPEREISELYRQQEVTLQDGSKFSGCIVNRTADKIILHLNLADPRALRTIDRKLIKSMEHSKNSMMPSGLLDAFHETEILDLVAYLLSKGDREDPMFK
ncbi:hypothetical protein BH11VER1_BH11VER1_17970 [soil metagenome]